MTISTLFKRFGAIALLFSLVLFSQTVQAEEPYQNFNFRVVSSSHDCVDETAVVYLSGTLFHDVAGTFTEFGEMTITIQSQPQNADGDGNNGGDDLGDILYDIVDSVVVVQASSQSNGDVTHLLFDIANSVIRLETHENNENIILIELSGTAVEQQGGDGDDSSGNDGIDIILWDVVGVVDFDVLNSAGDPCQAEPTFSQ